jgi:hypothetical protein
MGGSILLEHCQVVRKIAQPLRKSVFVRARKIGKTGRSRKFEIQETNRVRAESDE